MRSPPRQGTGGPPEIFMTSDSLSTRGGGERKLEILEVWGLLPNTPGSFTNLERSLERDQAQITSSSKETDDLPSYKKQEGQRLTQLLTELLLCVSL